MRDMTSSRWWPGRIVMPSSLGVGSSIRTYQDARCHSPHARQVSHSNAPERNPPAVNIHKTEVAACTTCFEVKVRFILSYTLVFGILRLSLNIDCRHRVFNVRRGMGFTILQSVQILYLACKAASPEGRAGTDREPTQPKTGQDNKDPPLRPYPNYFSSSEFRKRICS